MEFLGLILAALASPAAADGTFECRSPMYEGELAAAAAKVGEQAPEAARAALKRLAQADGDEGLRGHPGLGALLAVREKGAVIKRAVYCGGKGKHWVGVEAEDGRVFRLPLGTAGDPGGVDLARLEEERPAPAASPNRDRALRQNTGALALASLMGSPAALTSGAAFSLASDGFYRDAVAPVPSPLAVPTRPFREYCKAPGCRSKTARVTIDTDGAISDPELRALVASKGYDRHHRPMTSMSYAGTDGPARYLDSLRIPYVVKHRDSPWSLGDLVLVEHRGRRVVAIVGDSGNRRRLNEISHAAASALGIDPHGNKGGSSEPVTVTRLGDLRLPRPKNEAELFAALEAVRTWAGVR